MPKQVEEFLHQLIPYPSGPRLLELRKELDNHLLECMEEQLEQGLSEQQAFQAALLTLGSIPSLKRHINYIHRKDKKKKRSMQWIAGVGLSIIYPLILFLFFRDVNFMFGMIIPVLIGIGILSSVGYGLYMDIVMNKYEPLEDADNLLGVRMKYKE